MLQGPLPLLEVDPLLCPVHEYIERKTEMSGATTAVTAERMARQAAASPGTIALIRVGYAVKGLLYVVIGLLAARVALGDGGTTTDRKGALTALYTEPFGRAVLWVVVVGVLAYALWNLARALFDLDHKGTGAKALLTRLAYAGVGLSYAALALAAYHLVSGTGGTGKSSDTSTQDWTARLLAEPYGARLVELVGVLVALIAVYLFAKAVTASFQKQLQLAQAGATVRRWVLGLGRVGYAALGVVFAEIGIFLVIAGVRHDAHAAKGVGGSLQQLTREPYGHLLLGLVAFGLLAYGLFAFAQARYHQIHTA